ncbi:MAG: 3-hydroxyacyl-ACP dehydratase FabZ [Pseudomonadales bacterium]|nr:3-hydroxyacyl-ACP dehydratase FabZ [Pseudomonadales bacterium]
MLTINEIKSILPHRAPFLQVDKVLELEPGEYIVAVRGVSNSEEVFNGHFPDNPIFPGVLIIEAMAQTAGLLAFQTMGRGAHTNKAYVVAAVDKTKFRRSVVPGDQLILRATIISRKRTIWKFQAQASVDGQEVATAVITCAERDL